MQLQPGERLWLVDAFDLPVGERVMVVLVETFETVMGSVSGTLSFLRVAAFSLNHVALSIAVFTLADMLDGVGHWLMIVGGNIFVIVLAFVYLVLAAQYESFVDPLIVMLAIPFGLIGAILGHYLMGINLTILSMFGIFGLSGIVVNDSIILVTFYRNLREKGMAISEALVEAACQRLRAVLLTSLTTIAGLTPLLFETSLQAQFLIPMATSIAFGLAFATLLILFVVPSMLSVYESTAVRLGPLLRRISGRPLPDQAVS